jgi:hypothetical protein
MEFQHLNGMMKCTILLKITLAKLLKCLTLIAMVMMLVLEDQLAKIFIGLNLLEVQWMLWMLGMMKSQLVDPSLDAKTVLQVQLATSLL